MGCQAFSRAVQRERSVEMARTNPTRLAQLQREFQKNEAAPVQKPGVSRPRGAGDDETYARRREEPCSGSAALSRQARSVKPNQPLKLLCMRRGRPGVRKIAERFGVDPGTVQRISRPFEASAVSA
jgi:hypothetical protein